MCFCKKNGWHSPLQPLQCILVRNIFIISVHLSFLVLYSSTSKNGRQQRKCQRSNMHNVKTHQNIHCLRLCPIESGFLKQDNSVIMDDTYIMYYTIQAKFLANCLSTVIISWYTVELYIIHCVPYEGFWSFKAQKDLLQNEVNK